MAYVFKLVPPVYTCSDSIGINTIIRSVRTNKANISHAGVVMDLRHKAEAITPDVEDHPAILKNVRSSERIQYINGILPLRMYSNLVPSFEGFLGIGLPLPELAEPASRNDTPWRIIQCSRYGRK